MSSEPLILQVVREHSSPEFVAEMDANARRFDEASADLLADLRSSGVKVVEFRELHQGPVDFDLVLPVFESWLPQITYRPLQTGVIRVLGMKGAPVAAAQLLIRTFWSVDPESDDVPSHSYRSDILQSLSAIATDAVVDDVLEIALDRSHGRHRQLAVEALGNMKKSRDRVIPELVAMVDDDDVANRALLALARLRYDGVRALAEARADDPKPWIRAAARKVLKRKS